jgi:hypothetical protein
MAHSCQIGARLGYNLRFGPASVESRNHDCGVLQGAKPKRSHEWHEVAGGSGWWKIISLERFSRGIAPTNVLVLHRYILAIFTPRTFSRCLRRALLGNIIPRQNPIIAPRNAAMIAMPGENAPLVPANKKATYAMHRVHTIRRRFISETGLLTPTKGQGQ